MAVSMILQDLSLTLMLKRDGHIKDLSQHERDLLRAQAEGCPSDHEHGRQDENIPQACDIRDLGADVEKPSARGRKLRAQQHRRGAPGLCSQCWPAPYARHRQSSSRLASAHSDYGIQLASGRAGPVGMETGSCRPTTDTPLIGNHQSFVSRSARWALHLQRRSTRFDFHDKKRSRPCNTSDPRSLPPRADPCSRMDIGSKLDAKSAIIRQSYVSRNGSARLHSLTLSSSPRTEDGSATS